MAILIPKDIAKAGRKGQNGFVLLIVIVLFVAISGLIVSLQSTQRGKSLAVHAIERQTDGWLLAEAGLERAISAYLSRTDDLRDALKPDGRIATWDFSGKTINLAVTSESGKVDLLAGDTELVEALLTELLGRTAVRDDVRDRLATARATGNVSAVGAVVETVALHAAAAGIDAGRYLTIYSAQRTVDQETAPASLTKLIKSIRTDESGIFGRQLAVYTFSAQAFDHRGSMTGLDRIIQFDQNGGFRVLVDRIRNLPLRAETPDPLLDSRT